MPLESGQKSPPNDEVSLLDLFAIVAKRWRLVVTFPLLLFAIAVVVTIVQGPRFSVSSAFLVQGGVTPSSASGLAARFGVLLPQQDPGQSPQFYGQLVASDPILRQLVVRPYDIEGVTRKVTLVELFDSDGDTDAQRIQAAVGQLKDAIRTRVDDATGVVRIEVSSGWRLLSVQVAEQILALIDDFNIQRRQASAAAESAFTAARLKEVGASLRSAEDSLETFLRRNRQIANSPELLFQRDRLSRRVEMQQALYTTLGQALENAQIEAERNTPLIAVIEAPVIPARPDPRHLAAKALIALVMGVGIAVAIALSSDAIARIWPGRQDLFTIVKTLWSPKP